MSLVTSQTSDVVCSSTLSSSFSTDDDAKIASRTRDRVDCISFSSSIGIVTSSDYKLVVVAVGLVRTTRRRSPWGRDQWSSSPSAGGYELRSRSLAALMDVDSCCCNGCDGNSIVTATSSGGGGGRQREKATTMIVGARRLMNNDGETSRLTPQCDLVTIQRLKWRDLASPLESPSGIIAQRRSTTTTINDARHIHSSDTIARASCSRRC